MVNHFSNRYPYTDIHELNLDWLIRRMRELEIDMDEFKVVNNITFSGQWDITKQYPAWTIVSDNNIGYVSIQPVPAGVLLTNGNYWREVIDYSAQIAGLQSRVIALENTVGDNSSGLVKDVNDIQTDLIGIHKDVDRLKNLNMIMIGDSYGEQNDGSITKWYWEYVRDTLGLVEGSTFRESMRSGAGFGNGSFLIGLQTVAATMTSDEKEAVTDIFVCGGWNDSPIHQPWGTDTAFNQGVTDFDDYVKANFINAKVTVAHISWGDKSMRTDPNEVHFQLPISISRYSSLTKMGWRYITNSEYILHYYSNVTWQADGAHPKQYGQGLLGQMLPGGFLDGSVDVNRNTQTKTLVSIDATVTVSGGTDVLRESIHNNHALIELKADNVYLNGNGAVFNCNGTTQYAMVGSDFNYVKGNMAGTIQVPIRVYTGTKWKIGQATISLENNLFSIAMAIPNDAGTGLENALAPQFIMIPRFSMLIDSCTC